MAATCPHPAPLPGHALRRSYSRQEPSAVVPLAGICAGGRLQGRSLPRSTKGNTASKTRPGLSAGQDAPSALDRVRQVAVRDKKARFTALLHHVDVDRLRAAYRAINPNAAPGVDEVTWAAYGQDLEDNLRGLHERLHAGRYRARPTRRVYIPKADGRLRPLGIAALEDKILHPAVVEVRARSTRRTSVAFPTDFVTGVAPTTRWTR